MKTINNYVIDLFNKFGSDYRTAKELNISKVAMHKIRKKGQCSDETAVKIAELLEIEPEEVLIAAAIARSEGRVKAAWEKTAQRITATALIVLTTSCANYESIKDNGLSEIYIMRSIKRIFERMTRLFDFKGRVNEKTRKKTKVEVFPYPLERRWAERRKNSRDIGSYC